MTTAKRGIEAVRHDRRVAEGQGSIASWRTLYAKGGDKREEELALGCDPLWRRAPAHGQAGGKVGHEQPSVRGLNACGVDDAEEQQDVISGRDRQRRAPILRMQPLFQSLGGRLEIGDGSQVLV